MILEQWNLAVVAAALAARAKRLVDRAVVAAAVAAKNCRIKQRPWWWRRRRDIILEQWNLAVVAAASAARVKRLPLGKPNLMIKIQQHFKGPVNFVPNC